MNKKQYLDALQKELSQNGVADVGDVLADYEAHFARKALDGYTEEEIAHRLGNTREIAAEFLPDTAAQGKAGTAKNPGMTRLGLCFADLLALPFFLMMYVWAVAMLAASVAVFALGVYIALGMDLVSVVPVLPVAGGILTGASIAALSVLLFIGSVWFLLLSGRMTRAYLRWHGNRWFARHGLALPVMPQATGRKRRFVRGIVLVSLIGCIMLFAAGFIVMSIQAGTPGFWHYWHWFGPAV
jgi:uncharacterized membrane protein